MPVVGVLLLLIAISATPLGAVTQPDKPHDILLQMPDPPKPKWAITDPPPAGQPVMAQGSSPLRMVVDHCVLMDGNLNMDKGPADGLEVVVCMRDGKAHEALARVDLSGNQGRYIKYACIVALKLSDGMTTNQDSGVPARGTPVRLRVYWHDEDEGAWKVIDASCLVRDRDMDKAYPPLPFLYTGSRSISVVESGPDGQPVRRERFMLDNTRSIAVAYDEADALLASPFPGAREDGRFEANSALTPPVGAKLVISIEHAQLPLELVVDAKGGISEHGVLLDDAKLTARLAAVFAGLPSDGLRAFSLQVARSTDDHAVVELRHHALALAAAAKVWAVPVFVLPADDPAHAGATPP